jgi:hypothetical protein
VGRGPAHRGGSRRRWRRRGRRGQVAAVATLLSLLLIVTMIASYLSTQLPAQMQVNDANHVIVVENQVSRFAASLEAAAAAGAIGGVVTQPISLGSAGEPPFSPADGASIGPGVHGAEMTAAFVASGGLTYAPPQAGPAGGSAGPCATHTATTLTCTASKPVVWNFSSASATAFSVTVTGGPFYVNASASGSTFAVTATSTSLLGLLVVGNNDTLTVTITGTASDLRLIVLGNNDQVAFAAGTWTSAHVNVLLIGTSDSVSLGTTTMSSSQLTVSAYGSSDSVALGTTTLTSSGVSVYFNGFTPAAPTTECPDGNLASSTDSVSSSGAHTGGTYTVTYNDTTVSSGSAPPSPWTATFATPPQSYCPFVGPSTVPVASTGTIGASFVVHLKNTYIPMANVVFDQGAVVFAQSNGAPLMLAGPGVNDTNRLLTLWVPQFVGPLGTTAGTGTSVLSARIVSVSTFALPGNGYVLKTGSTIYLNVTTPYAAAWTPYLWGYVNNTLLEGSGTTVSCTAAVPSACQGPFSFNGPVGTVSLAIPAAAVTAVQLTVATYALSLT